MCKIGKFLVVFAQHISEDAACVCKTPEKMGLQPTNSEILI